VAGDGRRGKRREYVFSFNMVKERRVLSRVQRFLKMKKSPASVERRSSVQILKNVSKFLCIV
jgi:hypothetical protein